VLKKATFHVFYKPVIFLKIVGFFLLSDKSFCPFETKVIPNAGIEKHHIKCEVENYRMTKSSINFYRVRSTEYNTMHKIITISSTLPGSHSFLKLFFFWYHKENF